MSYRLPLSLLSVNDCLLKTDQVWLDMTRFCLWRTHGWLAPIEHFHEVLFAGWSGIYAFTRYCYVQVAFRLHDPGPRRWELVANNYDRPITRHDNIPNLPWECWPDHVDHRPRSLLGVLSRVPELRPYLRFSQNSSRGRIVARWMAYMENRVARERVQAAMAGGQQAASRLPLSELTQTQQ